MAVTIHLGPARLITPPTPPVVTGSLVWSNTGAINVTQGTSYQLATDVTNTTGDPATYAYHGPKTTGVGPVARTTGALPASQNATVESKNSWFEVATPEYPNVSENAYGPHFNGTDGATAYSPDECIRLRWPNDPVSGGSWLDANNQQDGSANSITFTTTGAGNSEQTFSTTAAKNLIDKLRTYRNAGIHYRVPAGGTGQVVLAHWHSAGASVWPQLTVITDTNPTGFVCPCTMSIFLTTGGVAEGPGNVNDGPGKNGYFQSPAVLKFDLSAVTGTTQAVKLRLNVNGAQTAALNFLNLPKVPIRPLLDLATTETAGAPPALFGVRTDGLVNAVSNDQALASHPDVMVYHDVTSEAGLRNGDYIAQGGYDAHPPYDFTQTTFAPWGLATWRTLPAGPGWLGLFSYWRTNVGLNPGTPRDLYMSYMLMLGDDVNAGAVDGWKMPGFEAYYPDEKPPESVDLSYRGWCVHVSRTNPLLVRYGAYTYDHLNPSSLGVYSGTWMKTGRAYHIEQFIHSNDVSPFADNGVHEVYVDDVLVMRRTGLRMRTGQESKIFTKPVIQLYHGGTTPTSGGVTFDLGRITFSKKYVGAPKRIA